MNTFDVAIVGAGIVGAACAAALAREGLKVVIIDKTRHRDRHDRGRHGPHRRDGRQRSAVCLNELLKDAVATACRRIAALSANTNTAARSGSPPTMMK